ncbi:hypothetical protein VSU16_16035 (plasmid) [Cetobacterium somerae]|nr:hypothetical protein [Cetobacterium somerae]WVJ03359.1 hypothetical protein VSU16_16035 [Cetobacterium somerae]
MHDDVLTILVLEVGHRSEIYKKHSQKNKKT